ncbi:MAG: AAA family ATPase [Planctomycetota bacterium]
MFHDPKNWDCQWKMIGCPEPPDWKLDWKLIDSSVPGLKALEACPQDPIWHAEGNVLIHTRMVCEQLTANPAWRKLNPTPRSILFAAALFHDICKPEVTQTIDGRIKAPKHAAKGARKARKMLYQKLLPSVNKSHFLVREQIADLVLHHGLPLHDFELTRPELKLIRISQYCRLDWVAMLSEADVRGRICDDKTGLLDRIELFREFCKEQKCFYGPRSFADHHTRFAYLNQKWNDPNSKAYNGSRSRVTLMSGLPGSGKDSWIRQNLPDSPVISLDAIRRQLKIRPTANQGVVISKAKEKALQLLRSGRSFVWNATNSTRLMRKRLIGLFSDYQAEVHIQYVEPSWENLILQNRTRTHAVPAKAIDNLTAKLEPPKPNEATKVSYWIGP